MNNEIMPYQGRDDIAIINSDLSPLLYEGFHEREAGPIRVTDIFIGRYGNLGYVEINPYLSKESVDVCKNIEIPGSLVDAIERVPGLTGYLREVIFSNENFRKYEEELDHPSLKGAKLFDSRYYWHCLGLQSPTPSKAAAIIKEYEADVINFIVEFERILDSFTRSGVPDFDKLLALGTREIPNEYQLK